MEFEDAKQEFIQAWGRLGTSWGINKAMAQIHALLLIAPDPLSTDEIMEALQISRGNANMNLRALMDWGIVYKIYVRGERKEYFASEKDVYALARQVAQERRKREIEPIIKLFNDVENVKGKGAEFDEFVSITNNLKSFATDSTAILDKFINNDKNWFFKVLKKLI
ncbi:MAG: transcriptional regulator [Chitinophagales bacterium]